MKKFVLLFLIAVASFLNAKPAPRASQEISGAAVEAEVEKIIEEIASDLANFKKIHPNAKDGIAEFEAALEEAKRIKALNDARHHFSEAMKFVNEEQLKGLLDRVKKIEATADLQAAMGKLTGTNTEKPKH